MTFDTYERAQSLRAEMKHLQDIADVLVSSRGNYLVASKLRCDENNYLLESNKILNGVEISLSNEPIIQKMVDLINTELHELEDKFSKL